MIIRDIHYNINSVHYSVHFRNRQMKRIKLQFLLYSCYNIVVIEKTYTKYRHLITKYYVIKEFEINET